MRATRMETASDGVERTALELVAESLVVKNGDCNQTPAGKRSPIKGSLAQRPPSVRENVVFEGFLFDAWLSNWAQEVTTRHGFGGAI